MKRGNKHPSSRSAKRFALALLLTASLASSPFGHDLARAQEPASNAQSKGTDPVRTLPEIKVEATAPKTPDAPTVVEASPPTPNPTPSTTDPNSTLEGTSPSDSLGTDASNTQPTNPASTNTNPPRSTSSRNTGRNSISSPFASPAASGYEAKSSTTGTLIDVPSIQVPASVDVVTASTIKDQNITRFTDVFRNVPGAVAVGDGLFPDRLFLRGLEVTSRDFRKNGFLDPTYTPRDFANIERVEILKGPGSVLYGSSNPAGVVNFITKKPVDAQFSTYNYLYGSYDLNRHEVDTNGRVTRDGKVLYRFNGSYEDSGSFRDFGFTRRFLIAPTVSWLIDRDTTLTWEGEIIENNRRGDTGIAALNGNPLALPPSRYLGEPGSDFLYSEDYRTSVVLNHRIDNDWSLQVGAYTVFYEFPGSQTFPVAQIGPTQLFRVRQNFSDQESSSSLIANLSGKMDVLGYEHKVVAGTEQVYYDASSRFAIDQLFEFPAFDAVAPVYGAPPLATVPAASISAPVLRQVRHGYYLQDYLTLNEHWQLLGGVRFDDVDMTYDRDFGLGSIRTEQSFQRTTPRVGVVYQPIPNLLSTYFNYSQSFAPPSGGAFPFTTQTVQAELGEMYEAGIKAQLTDDLAFRTAGFHIERQNVPFATFGLMGPQFFQVGLERSQGAELEMIGRLSRNWSLIGNYAYTDTELTDPNNPAIFGQRQRNVPLNQSSVWTRYNFVQHADETFGIAGGMIWVDDRTSNLSGSVILPSYTRWDTGLYYRLGRWDSSLYVENLFDKNYAQSSIDQFQIYPGSPTSLRGQIGVRF